MIKRNPPSHARVLMVFTMVRAWEGGERAPVALWCEPVSVATTVGPGRAPPGRRTRAGRRDGGWGDFPALSLQRGAARPPLYPPPGGEHSPVPPPTRRGSAPLAPPVRACSASAYHKGGSKGDGVGRAVKSEEVKSEECGPARRRGAAAPPVGERPRPKGGAAWARGLGGYREGR